MSSTIEDDKIAKIELMLASGSNYKDPTEKYFEAIVPASHSKRLSIINSIMRGKA